MNQKTLKWAQEQLKQLRQPAMAGRQYNEEEREEENREPSTAKKTNSDAEGEAQA